MKHHFVVLPNAGFGEAKMIYWICTRCGKRFALTREFFWKLQVLSDFKWKECPVPKFEADDQQTYGRLVNQLLQYERDKRFQG